MAPSPFIGEWIGRSAAALRERGRVAPCRALDIAMGRGRHACALARAGFRTFGVDVKLEAIRDAVRSAAAEHLALLVWCADLTEHPLPRDRFDVVIVSRYLQRDLFGPIQRSAAAGGVVLYETFTTAQRAHGTGPTSADHLLERGELRSRFEIEGWDVLFYEETHEPEAVARLAARRR